MNKLENSDQNNRILQKRGIKPLSLDTNALLINEIREESKSPNHLVLQSMNASISAEEFDEKNNQKQHWFITGEKRPGI